MAVDIELDAFLGLYLPDETTAGVPDEITKLFEDGALAGIVGGHATVEKFNSETKNIDGRANAIFKRDRSTPAPANDWNTEIIDDSQRLAKRYAAGIRSGKVASRIEKSANGKWTLEFDQAGELIRGYQNDA
jgi:hypothetical protein